MCKCYYIIITSLSCAGAVYAVVVCPSTRPSQAGIVSKQPDESSWFLAWRLPSIYSTLCCKEILVPREISVLPSGYRKFRYGKSIALSTKLVDGGAC